MSSHGGTEIHLLGFGEPANASPTETLAYLERIFLANSRLDGELSADQIRSRCRTLAARRAPGLLEDYRRIGGSPLLEQCRTQARELEAELERRGYGERLTVRIGMQFTAPFIRDVAKQAIAAGAEHIVALPLYPLCGASTTIAALDDLRHGLAGAAPGMTAPRVTEITGWHTHPAFIEAVAAGIEAAAEASGMALDAPATSLYFSAHGTPVKYLRDGSRYDIYVEEICALVAARLGGAAYAIGYQNHANRGIEWTSPSNEELLPNLEATRLVVVPVSFVHEQSETLVELDHDLRALAEACGKEMVRVPVPFAAPKLIDALADLVEPFIDGAHHGQHDPAPTLSPCLCRPGESAFCLNGARPG